MHMCLCPVWFHLYVLSPFSTPRTDWLFSFCSTNSKWVSLPQQNTQVTTQVNMTQIVQSNINVIASQSFKSKGTTLTPQFVDDAAGNWFCYHQGPQLIHDLFVLSGNMELYQGTSVLCSAEKKIRFVKWFLKVKLECWLFFLSWSQPDPCVM